MKLKLKFIIIIIIIILIIIGLFIILYRDNIFYFKPKHNTEDSFNVFLKKYNCKKYKSKIENIDIIDIPTRKKSKKVIVYFQGNYGNITKKEKMLQFLSDSFGVRIITIDYLRVKKVNIKNVVKVCQTLVNDLIDEGIDSDDMIIWGESIGCAIGLEIVSVCGIKNFIMLAGFRKMSDMIEVVVNNIFGKCLKKLVYELDNEEHIKNIKDLNIVVLHSKNDDYIPYYHIKLMIDKYNLEYLEVIGTHAKPIIPKKAILRIKEKYKLN